MKKLLKTKIKKYCIDCKKELSKLAYYCGYNRCKSCNNKFLFAGSGNPMFGKKHSEETKNKIRNKALGRIHTPNTKLLISNASKKRWKNLYYRNNMLFIIKNYWNKKENRILASKTASKRMKKIWQRRSYKKIQSLLAQERWEDKSFRAKVLKNLVLKPNKPEKILIKLLGLDYKYVGNGKFWIERYNPDFINCNGQKKIVEHFGTYWHNSYKMKIRDKNRLKTYKKYGYKTLIIWEKELKDLEKLSNKIITFKQSMEVSNVK